MTDINTLLILVFANWCGHCIKYLNLDNSSDKSLWKEICKDLRESKEIKEDGINLDIIDFEESQIKTLLKSDKKSLHEMGIKYNINFKDLNDKVEFFPTLIILTKDTNGKFKTVENIFNGNKENIKDIIKYISNNKKYLKGGRIKVDYRQKYKKYKKLYLDLINKKIN